MSIGIFGSGGKTTKQTTTTQTTTQDMRTAVGGSVDNLVSPGAAVGGSIVAGQGANVTTSTTNTGFGAKDVTGLMEQMNQDRAAERASVGSLGASLAAGLSEQGSQLADILGATKAPEASTMGTLLPLLLLVVLLAALR